MNMKTRKLVALFILALMIPYFVLWAKVWFLPFLSNPFFSTKNNLFDNPLIPFIPLGFGFILVALMYRKDQPTTVHGSAHFATPEEIKTYGTLAVKPRKERGMISKALTRGEIPPSKMHLGIYQNKLIVLDEHMQESHVFLLAPSGVGKTSRIIVPALLREYGNRSLFINDTKGELVELTIGHLSKYHQCFIFAPTNPRKSHHYNPLSHVHNMDDAEALASCLIDNTGTSREEFWNSAPKLLVTATVLHLCTTEPNAPFSRLFDILCGMKLSDIEDMFRHSPEPVTQKVATAFFENLQKNDRLAGSIMIEMSTRFFRFQNPALREVTSSNDLNFTRMVDEPQALFLSIPEGEAERLEPLSACLIMQMMNSMVRRAARSPEGRLPHDFAFYLDEFCNAGSIPKFTRYISTVRSRGIAFILAVQDFGQLRNKYGEDGRDTILTNCSTHVVFPGCGVQETGYYSKKMGKTTVPTITRSDRDSSGWLNTAQIQTQTHGETQRDLMTPDELRTMVDDTLLILVGKLHPLLVQNTAYYQDRDLLAQVRQPFTRPASRVRVTPVPPTPPPLVASLPAPKTSSGNQKGEPPPGPKPRQEATNQDDEQFFSPE